MSTTRLTTWLYVLSVSCLIAVTYLRFSKEFTARISKYNARRGAWEPFSGIQDIQFEFTMLDPHIRAPLPAVPGKPGMYSITFRAPDRHGVFKFVINHKRKGYETLPLTLCIMAHICLDGHSWKVRQLSQSSRHGTTDTRASSARPGPTTSVLLAPASDLFSSQRCGSQAMTKTRRRPTKKSRRRGLGVFPVCSRE